MSRKKKSGDKEFIYPNSGEDVPCPDCDMATRVIIYWMAGDKGRAIFLDRESCRYPANSLPLALEHGTRGAPCNRTEGSKSTTEG